MDNIEKKFTRDTLPDIFEFYDVENEEDYFHYKLKPLFKKRLSNNQEADVSEAFYYEQTTGIYTIKFWNLPAEDSYHEIKKDHAGIWIDTRTKKETDVSTEVGKLIDVSKNPFSNN